MEGERAEVVNVGEDSREFRILGSLKDKRKTVTLGMKIEEIHNGS